MLDYPDKPGNDISGPDDGAVEVTFLIEYTVIV